jgi:hypothetical protein
MAEWGHETFQSPTIELFSDSRVTAWTSTHPKSGAVTSGCSSSCCRFATGAWVSNKKPLLEPLATSPEHCVFAVTVIKYVTPLVIVTEAGVKHHHDGRVALMGMSATSAVAPLPADGPKSMLTVHAVLSLPRS